MITVKQYTAKDGHGKTVAFEFDSIVWDDAGTLRNVGVVGHGENDPIQLLENVPEATKAKISEAVERAAAERRKHAAKGDGTGTRTATGRGIVSQ